LNYRIVVLWLGLALVFVAGCDPVSKTMQPVTVNVVDLRTSDPAAGVLVDARWSSSRYPATDRSTAQGAWEAGRFAEFARTDRTGTGRLELKTVAIDHWQLKAPDRITGAHLLVSVGADPDCDVFPICCMAGATCAGERYRVTVQSVGKPEYVPMP